MKLSSLILVLFHLFLFSSSNGKAEEKRSIGDPAIVADYLRRAVAIKPPFGSMTWNKHGYMVLDWKKSQFVAEENRSFAIGFSLTELQATGFSPKLDNGLFTIDLLPLPGNGIFYTDKENLSNSKIVSLAKHSGRVVQTIKVPSDVPGIMIQYKDVTGLDANQLVSYVAMHESFHILQWNSFSDNPTKFWRDGLSSPYPRGFDRKLCESDSWNRNAIDDAKLLADVLSGLLDKISTTKIKEKISLFLSNRNTGYELCWNLESYIERDEGMADFFAFELLEKSNILSHQTRSKSITNVLERMVSTGYQRERNEPWYHQRHYVRGHALALILSTLDTKQNWQTLIMNGARLDKTIEKLMVE